MDNEKFAFSVQVTETQPDDIIFRIGADGIPFASPTERIAVNFDSVTGLVTTQLPEVQTFGTPPFDRWLDGSIPDFAIEAVSVGVWKISGSVPVGTDTFQPGDSIWGVALRTDTTVFSGAVEIDACESDNPSAIVLKLVSTWASPYKSRESGSETKEADVNKNELSV